MPTSQPQWASGEGTYLAMVVAAIDAAAKTMGVSVDDFLAAMADSDDGSESRLSPRVVDTLSVAGGGPDLRARVEVVTVPEFLLRKRQEANEDREVLRHPRRIA